MTGNKRAGMCKEEWPDGGVPRRHGAGVSIQVVTVDDGQPHRLCALYAFNSYRIVAGDNIAIVLLTEIITLCVLKSHFNVKLAHKI